MYNFRERLIITLSLVTLDLGSLFLTLWVAYQTAFSDPATSTLNYLWVSAILPIVWLLLFLNRRLYDPTFILAGWDEYKQVVNASVLGMLAAVLILVLLERTAPLSRTWIFILLIGATSLVGVARFLFRRIIRALRRYGYFVNRAIIVGANTQGAAIARQWHRNSAREIAVLGFVDDYLPTGVTVTDQLTVLGPTTALTQLVQQHNAQEIVVVPSAVAWETYEEILELARTRDDLLIRFSPGAYELLATGVTAIQRGFVPLLSLERTRITGTDALLKSLLDYGLGLTLTLAALPLFGLFALLLKLTRPTAPILQPYRLIGLKGRPFETFKFRTDIPPHARARQFEPPGPVTMSAFQQAPALHRFLYRTGLDKLPQLFSVLTGRMSLVGPHPIMAHDTPPSLAYNQRRNLETVKPGLTGPWAVGDATSFDEEVRQDLYYVRNWTIWLDLQILVETAILALRFRAPLADLLPNPQKLPR